MTAARRAVIVAAIVAGNACGGDGAGPPPVLPADYASTYASVYACRESIDHDLNHVVVWASPNAVSAYRAGVFPLPVGTVIVKDEFSDEACTTRVAWTVMRKEAPGYAPASADWHWQKLDADRKVLLDGSPSSCVSCHSQTVCWSRDLTCEQP